MPRGSGPAIALFLLLTWLAAADLRAQVQDVSKIPNATGVLTVIPSDLVAVSKDGTTAEVLHYEDTTSPVLDVTELTSIPDLSWTPQTSSEGDTLAYKAKMVQLSRAIWQLEFGFKPVRMIEVDLPQVSGKMQRKRLWYMVYRVANRGRHLLAEPVVKDAGTSYVPKISDTLPEGTPPIRFFPHFVLSAPEQNKEYLDRVIPAAQKWIERRETRNGGTKLYHSVEISQIDLPVSTDKEDRSVWGYVTWEDVDPRIDAFSIQIQGLTNAYRILPATPEEGKAGEFGASRRLALRTLQLNFWRPSDAIGGDEREFRFGVQIDTNPVAQKASLDRLGLSERLDHLWIYR